MSLLYRYKALTNWANGETEELSFYIHVCLILLVKVMKLRKLLQAPQGLLTVLPYT